MHGRLGNPGSILGKPTLAVPPSNSIPRYLHKRNETDVYSGMCFAALQQPNTGNIPNVHQEDNEQRNYVISI